MVEAQQACDIIGSAHSPAVKGFRDYRPLCIGISDNSRCVLLCGDDSRIAVAVAYTDLVSAGMADNAADIGNSLEIGISDFLTTKNFARRGVSKMPHIPAQNYRRRLS